LPPQQVAFPIMVNPKYLPDKRRARPAAHLGLGPSLGLGARMPSWGPGLGQAPAPGPRTPHPLAPPRAIHPLAGGARVFPGKAGPGAWAPRSPGGGPLCLRPVFGLWRYNGRCGRARETSVRRGSWQARGKILPLF
jgi:hypothetical protein